MIGKFSRYKEIWLEIVVDIISDNVASLVFLLEDLNGIVDQGTESETGFLIGAANITELSFAVNEEECVKRSLTAMNALSALNRLSIPEDYRYRQFLRFRHKATDSKCCIQVQCVLIESFHNTCWI